MVIRGREREQKDERKAKWKVACFRRINGDESVRHIQSIAAWIIISMKQSKKKQSMFFPQQLH